MYRLIYISTASEALMAEDVDAIVETSIRNNEPRNITGVLIFNGLNFLQVLEGSQASVNHIYKLIQLDTRHISVTTLLSETAELRMFSGWSMAGRKTKELAGRHEYDEMNDVRDVMDRQMPSRVRTILNNFTSLKGL
jgi:Sensors of blue-light using FAD